MQKINVPLDSAGIGPQNTNRCGHTGGTSKQFLIAGAMLCAITTTGAHAVTKCAALNSSTTCTSDYSQDDTHIDWAATCTTNGVSTPISGIGICSSTECATHQYATATELDTSFTTNDHKYCWCKMISPAVSRWVSVGPYTSAGDCARYCTYACAVYPEVDAGFRSALFGSLSD